MDWWTDVEFSGKVIVEIGTGNGAETWSIAEKLIDSRDFLFYTVDIEDCSGVVEEIMGEYSELEDKIKFLRMDASDARILEEIGANSVDIVIMNFTLCGIFKDPSRGSLALLNIRDMLKGGGMLFIEEEFPITILDNVKFLESYDDKERELVLNWVMHWRLLKTAVILSGFIPYNETYPDALSELLGRIGFKNVSYSSEEIVFHSDEFVPAFWDRFSAMLREIMGRMEDFGLKKKRIKGIADTLLTLGDEWSRKVKGSETIIVPTYQISAIKKGDND